MRINETYRSNDDSYCLQGVHRLLWLNPKLDLAVTIAVPDYANSTPHYFPSPKKRSYAAIDQAISAGTLLKCPLKAPPLACMADAQIRKRYPGRKGAESKPISVRDGYLAALSTILDVVASDPRSFYEDDVSAGLIRDVVETSSFRINQVYSALNKYLAMGIGANGLLPLTNRCGGPGKERNQDRRLGRKTLAHACGVASTAGATLSPDDKENLAYGWRVFMNGSNSVEDAYVLTMGVFWSDGNHVVDGEAVPRLLPTDRRPSLSQFRRWGPKGEENQDAWLTLLSDQEWEKSYRARYGTALDGIRAVGQVAVGDATSNDVSLVSMTSRLKPIGSSNRLILHDAFSDIIAGFHVGLDAPCEQVALLAVLNAATSKVEFCRRYGVDIDEDDIPPIFFAKYLVDNGEYRTAHSMKTATGLGSGFEYVGVGRADHKGRSEAGHRSLHKLSSHKIAGTTRGRQRKRGEDAPAYLSCWRYHEYVRLLLKAIRYFNCEQRVSEFMDQHPYRTAMKRDGVPPIRKAIYQWGVNQGLIASPPFNEDRLRAALLPKMKASVQATGVYLIRPDRGDRNDLVKAHRFIGPRSTELQWLERARRKGPFQIEVRANPNEMRSIWYVDEEGIHELLNRSNDVLLVESGTLADSLAIQDQDTIDEESARGQTEQAKSDLVAARTATNDANRRAKAAEKMATGKKPTKKQLAGDIRGNRADEKALMEGQSQDAASSSDSSGPQIAEPQPSEAPTEATPDWMDQILDHHRQEDTQDEHA